MFFADIRVVFNLFDVNDDGKLTVNEMIQAMVSLEMPVNKKLVKKVFKSTDTDGNVLFNWEQLSKPVVHVMLKNE